VQALIVKVEACSGFFCFQVLDEIKPGPDEIVLPKTSSSVFCSTNLDYILRNLGIRYIILVSCFGRSAAATFPYQPSILHVSWLTILACLS
jgi:Isochorismatase family